MWTVDDLRSRLEELGVTRNDRLFVHSSLVHLGRPARDLRAVAPACIRLLDDLVGPGGALGMPTFSYSYLNDEVFHIERSPSAVGALTELFRTSLGVQRTSDPIFSAAFLRPPAEFGPLFEVPRGWNCFGEDGMFAHLLRADFRLLFLGIGFEFCTFIHHVEQRLGVGYRYLKRFEGRTARNGQGWPTEALYFVRDLDNDVETFLKPLESLLLERRCLRKLPFGPGSMSLVRARDVFQLTAEAVKAEPLFLLKKGHGRTDASAV